MHNIKINPCVAKDVDKVERFFLNFPWHKIPLIYYLSSYSLHILFEATDNASQGRVRDAEEVKTVGSIFRCKEGDINLMTLHTCTVHVNLMSVVLDLKREVKISFKPVRRDTGCVGVQSLNFIGLYILKHDKIWSFEVKGSGLR